MLATLQYSKHAHLTKFNFTKSKLLCITFIPVHSSKTTSPQLKTGSLPVSLFISFWGTPLPPPLRRHRLWMVPKPKDFKGLHFPTDSLFVVGTAS